MLKHLLRRADREAEGARLLSEYTPQGYLGFESPALRQNAQAGRATGLLFCCPGFVSWGFEPERARQPSGLSRGEGAARAAGARPQGARRGSPALRQNAQAGRATGLLFVARDSSAGDSNPRGRDSPAGCHVARAQPEPPGRDRRERAADPQLSARTRRQVGQPACFFVAREPWEPHLFRRDRAPCGNKAAFSFKAKLPRYVRVLSLRRTTRFCPSGLLVPQPITVSGALACPDA